MHEELDKIVYCTLIAPRRQRDALLAMLCAVGARMVHTQYGRGSVKAGYLQNVLGLVPEEHKVVITCVLTKEKFSAAHKELLEKFHFDRPNTGIAFTIPIDNMSF